VWRTSAETMKRGLTESSAIDRDRIHRSRGRPRDLCEYADRHVYNEHGYQCKDRIVPFAATRASCCILSHSTQKHVDASVGFASATRSNEVLDAPQQ
jgi:hypothetical protein